MSRRIFVTKAIVVSKLFLMNTKMCNSFCENVETNNLKKK
jgi:hypothetical protein